MGKSTPYYVATLLCLLLVLACGGDDDDPKIPDTPSTDPPEITNVDPYEGEVGDDVDIIGENFSTTLGENQVKFGNIDAEVTNATATKLDVTVPDGAETAKITVTVNNQTATSENEFVVNDSSDPIITDFNPMEGVQGDHVTIIGKNFGNSADDILVYIGNGGQVYNIISVEDTEIVVEVSEDASTGPIYVSVANSNPVSSAEEFKILPWRQLTGLENPRTKSFVETIGDKLYIGFGEVSSSEGLDDFWEFDSNTHTWSSLASFPGGPRQGVVHFVIGNILYVGLGTNGDSNNVYNDLYAYNPESNTWTPMTDFPIDTDKRVNAASCTVNGKAYLYGGHRKFDSHVYNDFWVFDPTGNNGLGSWEELEGFEEEGRTYHVSFVLNNKCYFGMGKKAATTKVSDFWEYDPNTETWSKFTDISEEAGGRIGSVSFVYDGFVYIGMGIPNNSNSGTSDLYSFDPNTNVWTKKTDFPNMARRWNIAGYVNGKAYFGFGDNHDNEELIINNDF